MKKLFFVLITAAVLTACQPASPPATPATIAILAPTEIPNTPPALSGPHGEIILTGEHFTPIELPKYTQDAESPSSEVLWGFSGGGELNVEINAAQQLTVTPPSDSWTGVETILLEACDPGGLCTQQAVEYGVSAPAPITITHINNAGFLIESGGYKIAIDTFYDPVAIGHPFNDALLAALNDFAAPLDDLDLLLITHEHHDHMTPSMVAAFAAAHPNTPIISTEPAITMLTQQPDFQAAPGQLFPLALAEGESQRFAFNGVGVEAIFLSHGADIDNLGFLITIGGQRILHTGDLFPVAESEQWISVYDLPERQIDLAFVPYIFFDREDILAIAPDYIQADLYVPMHFGGFGLYNQPLVERVLQNCPEHFIFTEPLQSWVMPES